MSLRVFLWKIVYGPQPGPQSQDSHDGEMTLLPFEHLLWVLVTVSPQNSPPVEDEECSDKKRSLMVMVLEMTVWCAGSISSCTESKLVYARCSFLSVVVVLVVF